MIMASPVSTKVVYFLDTSMSKQLLCKFPDTSSAFDFDQTQSSIWSPLVPRIYSAMDYPKPRNRNRRRVSIGGAGMGYKLKKFTSNIKKKLNVTAFNLNLNLNPFNNNNKINPSHVSETPLKTTKDLVFGKKLKEGDGFDMEGFPEWGPKLETVRMHSEVLVKVVPERVMVEETVAPNVVMGNMTMSKTPFTL
uniref:Uncharacterized protein n=1 Tax=Fagus sylvatica TaxID=28930 RepID=A0A2N9ITA0_FAGSY